MALSLPILGLIALTQHRGVFGVRKTKHDGLSTLNVNRTRWHVAAGYCGELMVLNKSSKVSPASHLHLPACGTMDVETICSSFWGAMCCLKVSAIALDGLSDWPVDRRLTWLRHFMCWDNMSPFWWCLSDLYCRQTCYSEPDICMMYLCYLGYKYINTSYGQWLKLHHFHPYCLCSFVLSLPVGPLWCIGTHRYSSTMVPHCLLKLRWWLLE